MTLAEILEDSAYHNAIAGQMQVEQHFKGASGQIESYSADIAIFWCPEFAKATGMANLKSAMSA